MLFRSDNDSDGISIGANVLTLNSGTIRDAAGNNATLTHSSVSDNTSYKVDTTAPTVSWSAATDNIGTVTGALTSGDTTDDTMKKQKTKKKQKEIKNKIIKIKKT